MFGKIGINVSLNAQTKSKHFKELKNDKGDFYMLGWGVPTLDSHYVFHYLYDSKGSWNKVNFNNARVDELIRVMETEVDLDKKAEGGEVKDEKTTQDSDKPADTPEKLDESVDVRDRKDDEEQDKKEEVKVKPQEQKKEMEEYSEGVQKRIAKLTRKMREAERQKEEAVTYAKRVMRERDALTHTATCIE